MNPDPAGWHPPLWVDRVTGSAWRFIVVFVVVSLGLGIIASLEVVVLPLFLGLLFASVLAPLSAWLRRHRVPNALAAALCVLLLLALLGFAIYLSLKAVASEWDSIIVELNDGTDQLSGSLADSGALTEEQAQEMANGIAKGVGVLAGVVAGGVFTLVAAVFELVTTLLLSMFVTFFYVKDGATLWSWLMVRVGDPEGLLDTIGQRCFKAIAAYVRGAAMVATVDAVFIGLGAWILGVPFPMAIFILTFFLSFVPYVGAVTAGAFVCLLAVAEGGLELGLAMLLVVVFVQQLESNLLEPVILGKATHLHPLFVVLVIVGAGAVAGFVGVVVVIPIASALTAAVSELRAAGWFSTGASARFFDGPPGDESEAVASGP